MIEAYSNNITAVTNLIEQTKKKGKAVPDSMMDFYEYLHKRHVCEYEKSSTVSADV